LIYFIINAVKGGTIAMSKFIIKKAKSGLMFNFVASNGEVVATSEVYTTKKALTNKKFENIFLNFIFIRNE
jgi:domain of unknown function (DUF1508)